MISEQPHSPWAKAFAMLVFKYKYYFADFFRVRGTPSPLPLPIPYICHFFTRAKFLENKIYTEKQQFFALNL